MILTKTTEAEAQALADRCHEYLIVNDEAYAASAFASQTLQWAIPSHDEETGLWSVPVELRCAGALTDSERIEAGLDSTT